MFKYLLAALLVFHACSATPAGLKPRITDGEEAMPGEFPHQVSIMWGISPLIKHKHICGGSILNEKWVLTAGHCIMKMGTFRVAAGKHYLMKAEDTEQVVKVVKTIVHEGYKGGVAQHDIALMQLEKPLEFNDRVAAIKLPQQDEKQTGEAVLSGWGSISKKMRPVLPATLQKADVPLLENDDCYNQLSSKKPIGKRPEIFNTQICSGAAGGEVSACSGDSGGPLAQADGDGFVQVGVVSWGMFPCGAAGTPSVYTRVASYVDWINKQMA